MTLSPPFRLSGQDRAIKSLVASASAITRYTSRWCEDTPSTMTMTRTAIEASAHASLYSTVANFIPANF